MTRDSNDQPRESHPRRNPDITFTDLCARLVWHGRTREVNAALDERLSGLRTEHWYVVRDLSICSVRIPLVLFGATGVFLLQGSRGYWTNWDIVDMVRSAETLRAALIDYPSRVHCAIVVLEDRFEHRQHFASTGEGPCWIVCDEMVIHWLYRFSDHGLSEADVAFLRAWAAPSRASEPRRILLPRGGDGGCAEG
jgi:hypothetical protein